MTLYIVSVMKFQCILIVQRRRKIFDLSSRYEEFEGEIRFLSVRKLIHEKKTIIKLYGVE